MAARLAVDAVPLEETHVGWGVGLGLELGGDDVEHVFEMVIEAKARQHRDGVAAGAVGEDQLAAGELLDRYAERGVGLERGVVDLVYEVEEVVRLHAVLGHQPAHRGAVALVVVLLQPERVLSADLEVVRDVVADALVDLLPQVDVMRIERVVEVEHPGFDMIEGTRRGTGAARHSGGSQDRVRCAFDIRSYSRSAALPGAARNW